MTSISNKYSVTTVHLDMNMLASFASPNEPNEHEHEPTSTNTINAPMTFIGRLSRLINSTFGTGNTVVYASDDVHDKV
jgi:hypothetical protein